MSSIGTVTHSSWTQTSRFGTETRVWIWASRLVSTYYLQLQLLLLANNELDSSPMISITISSHRLLWTLCKLNLQSSRGVWWWDYSLSWYWPWVIMWVSWETLSQAMLASWEAVGASREVKLLVYGLFLEKSPKRLESESPKRLCSITKLIWG